LLAAHVEGKELEMALGWHAATTALARLMASFRHPGPSVGHHGIAAPEAMSDLAHQLDFCVCVVLEFVQGDDTGTPKLRALPMCAPELEQPFSSKSDSRRVFVGERFAGHHLRSAAVHLQRTNGGHQHDAIRRQAL